MSRKRLVLMASKQMDSNKKEKRNEHVLIRMSSTARDNMGFHDDKVELWPVNASGEERLNKSIMLTVFHAFKADVKDLKADVAKGKVTEEKYARVGFVSTKTFNRICGSKKNQSENIWISNEIYDTVLGTDPEFLLFEKNRNRIVRANGVLPNIGEIGCDGAMAEIRPKPEVSVNQLVENMKAIFNTNKDHEKIGGLRWFATCYHQDSDRAYPVGGHIHVGNPKQLMSKSESVRSKFYKVLNKILDEFLALPLVKLDGPDGGKRRKKGSALYSGYGHYGGFRTDLGRLEHRTLSGIWMVHPSISRAVLGTAKAIIDESFKITATESFKSGYILPNNFSRSSIWGPDFDRWDEIPLARDMKCTRDSGKMIGILNGSDHTYMTGTRIKELHKRLRGLSTYNENSDYIDGFCEILRIKFAEFEKYNKEIKKNWLGKKKFIVQV